MSSPKR
ncbi:unnamed protein product [Rhodiola kirilowii]